MPASAAPLRSDVWNVANPHARVCLNVVIDAEPGSLCRLLNLFAMQYLTPEEVHSSRQDDTLHVQMELDGLTWHRAEVIAQKMRNLVDVHSVELELAEPAPQLASA
ncbi:hypothetical protein GUY40_20100 [Pseudomonas sp. R5(2019)]|nr:hypothetical protein [Pseudomonas sp. R5(2019)]NBA97220.1 hypothetical protein [Pseudomonas sp. R5(2019)]